MSASTGVLPHSGEQANEHVRGRPAGALRPYVAGYSGYRQSGGAAAVHRGLPSPYLTLILTLDDPLEMAAHPDPRQPAGTYVALLGGLHTRPALIRNPGHQSGIQVNVHPLGAGRLLGLPAGELASSDVPLDAVWGPRVEQLRAQLLGASTWAERFGVLDGWLLTMVQANPAKRVTAPELIHAWTRLRASAGQVRMADLAAETGWSARHLAGRFHAEVGLSPKGAARVVRFDRARRTVMQRAGGGLAEIAAECGYFDQAHLTREFRELAGVSPTAWLAEEFRNVQDVVWPKEDAQFHD